MTTKVAQLKLEGSKLDKHDTWRLLKVQLNNFKMSHFDFLIFEIYYS